MKNNNDTYVLAVQLRNYEGGLLWTRNQVFLIINSAFLTMQIAMLNFGYPKDYEAKFIVSILSFVGMVISVMWIFAIQRSEIYDSYWSMVIKKFESENKLYPLFSDIQEFLEKQKPMKRSIKIGTIAKFIASCFLLIWAMMIVYNVRH